MKRSLPELCIHWHAALPSTNVEAIRLARAGAPEGTVVWAERQTAGRGRRGRAWESPPGNLYMSVVARPDLPAARVGRLSATLALLLAGRLRAISGLAICTKWPNDLYLEGRKLGGLLVESRLRPGGAMEWVVAGIGVNVAVCPEVAPPGAPATRLAAHGPAPAPEGLVLALAPAVMDAAQRAGMGGWSEWANSRWREWDLAAGPVRILEGDREYDAEGLEIGDDGALLARIGKEVHRVTAGEVSVRPARAKGAAKAGCPTERHSG